MNEVEKLPGEPDERARKAVAMRYAGKDYPEIVRKLKYKNCHEAELAVHKAVEWAFAQAEKEREEGTE